MATVQIGVSGEPGDARLLPMVELKTTAGRRPGLVLLGLVFITASAMGGAVLVRSSSETAAALVLSRDVGRGEMLSAADLRVVEFGPGPGLSWVGPDSQDRIVGTAATERMVAGQLITAEMFGDRSSAIGAGRVIVAAALRPGDVPLSVQPGDRVRLQSTAGAAAVQAIDDRSIPRSEPIGEADVWSVVAAASGGMVISLLVDESLEPGVSQSATTGTLKVNIVGGGG